MTKSEYMTDEEFWDMVDRELAEEADKEYRRVIEMTDEEYYKEYVLRYQTPEEDEMIHERSIEVI